MESRQSSGVRHHCCNICGKVKPITLEYFYSDGHTRDGAMRFRTQCKSCLALVRRLCRQGYVRDDAMAAVKRFIAERNGRADAESGPTKAGSGNTSDACAPILGALTHDPPSRQLVGSQDGLDAALHPEAAHAIGPRSATQRTFLPHASADTDTMHAVTNEDARRPYHAEWTGDSHSHERALAGSLWNTPDAASLLQSKLLQSGILGLDNRFGGQDANAPQMQTLAARILAHELLANNDAEIAATLFDLRRKQNERATLLNILESERNLARPFDPDALHNAAAALPHHLQQPAPLSALPSGTPNALQLAQLHQLLSSSLGVEVSDDTLQRLVANLAAQAAPSACKAGARANSSAAAPWVSAPSQNAAASWLVQALGQAAPWPEDVQRGLDVRPGRLGNPWPAASLPVSEAPPGIPLREAPSAAALSKLDTMLRAADAVATRQKSASGGRAADKSGIQGDLPSRERASWPVGKSAPPGVPEMPHLSSLPDEVDDVRNRFAAADDPVTYVASQLRNSAARKSQGNAASKPDIPADGRSSPELQEVAVQLLNGLLGGSKKAAKQPAAKRAVDETPSKLTSKKPAAAAESPDIKAEDADDRPLHDLRRSKNWSAIANHFPDSNPTRTCRACGECKELTKNFHVHRWRQTSPGRKVPQTFYWHCKQCHNHISAAIRRGETRSLAVATIQVSRRAAAAETSAANSKLRAQVQEELKAATASTRGGEPTQGNSPSGSRKCTCCNTWQPLESFDHGDSGRSQLCTTCHKKIFKNGPPASRGAAAKEPPQGAQERAVTDADRPEAAQQTARQPEAASQARANGDGIFASKARGLHPIATHSRPMTETPPQQLPRMASTAAVSGAADTASPPPAAGKRARAWEHDEAMVLKQKISEDLDASYVSVVSHASRLGNAAWSEPLSPASNEGASTSQPCAAAEKSGGEAAGTGATVDVLAALQLLELKRGPQAGEAPRRSASADSGHAHAQIEHSAHCDMSVESNPAAHA